MKKTVNKTRILKTTLLLFVLLFIVSCHDEVVNQDHKNNVIVIYSDDNLARCIQDTGLSREDIIQLDCRAYNIITLDGIEFLNNLQALDLRENKIIDILPLVALEKSQMRSNNLEQTASTLKIINLSNNQISNVSALQSLNNNIEIDLSNNPIKELIAPTKVRAYKRDNSIVLRWQQSPGAISYNIYMAKNEAGIDFNRPIANSKIPRVVIDNLDNDVVYTFYVSAKYPTGEGLFSASVQASARSTIKAPLKSNILFLHASESRIYIDWSEVNDIEQYDLRLSNTENFNHNDVITVENVNPPHEVLNFPRSDIYYVQVRTKNAIGESLSDVIPINTGSPRLSARTQALFAIPGENRIDLDWTLDSRYTSVRLFFGTTENVDENTGLEFPDPEPPIIHRGVAASVTYYYLLLATDEDNNELRQRVFAQPKLLTSALLISDPSLRQCIDDSEIEFVSDIMALNCEGYGITSLAGIGQLDRLALLDLSHNNLIDLSPLADVETLTEINLFDNEVESIQPLGELSGLTSIQLQANQISDISPLENLTQLESLGLSENPISDISTLENLNNLKKLQLANTEVVNLTALGGLDNLSFLNVADNNIINIEPIGNLTTLVYLDVSENFITDFTALNKLLLLRYFNNATQNREIPNIAPIADAGDMQTVFVGDTVLLSASNSSDEDGNTLLYNWDLTQTPENSVVEIVENNKVEMSFEVDVAGEYVIQLSITDEKGDADSVTVSVIVRPVVITPPRPPTANAGNDQALIIGQAVLLDGTLSVAADSGVLQYQWEFLVFPQDSEAVIIDSDKAQSSFIPDLPGEYQAQLIVSVDGVSSSPDSVIVTSNNLKPSAKAGDDQWVLVGSTVQLDGSESFDRDGEALSFQWQLLEQPENATATLINDTQVRPELMVDLPGAYIVALVVNDSLQESEIDQVILTTEDPLPIAHAGYDMRVNLNDTVNLDGSASYDLQNQALSYQWSLISKPQDSNSTLAQADQMRSVLTIDTAGQYVAQLIVNDGANNSEPSILILNTNDIKPVANPGDDIFVLVDEILTLDGSDSLSTNGNENLLFNWSLVNKPVASRSELMNDNTVTPSINIDQEGDYVVQLIVSDGTTESLPNNILISTGNLRPVAVITDSQIVIAGETVVLDSGESYDANQDLLNYSWALIIQPELSNQSISDPTAMAPLLETLWEGVYVAQLTVDDGQLTSLPDTIVLDVEVGTDDDNDGLNNALEARYGTDPQNADSDDDGLSDGEEIKKYRTDPNDDDTDGDGLGDYDEIMTYKTDPKKEDSDNDGWTDSLEIEFGTDPNSTTSLPFISVVGMPQNINVLRSGFNPNELGVIIATPENINVLRSGEGEAGELRFNTVIATPDEINILRTGTGEGEFMSTGLNIVIASPSNINILRPGEGIVGELLLNTIVATPQILDVEVVE